VSAGDPQAPAPPPPSPTLRAIVAGTQPVRMRRPWRAFGLLVGASGVYLALWLTRFHHRRDLAYLPLTWWALLAVVWLGGFLLPLGLAILPRRGSVLPDGARASVVALTAAAALLVVGFLLTPTAPAHTLIPVGFARTSESIGHCLTLGLAVALGPLAAGLLALRPLLIVGGARLMGAVGAAAGALGGLLLHIICAVGGPMHVGFGHAGVVVAAGILGALVGLIVGRR
jgi:hypothetical protein